MLYISNHRAAVNRSAWTRELEMTAVALDGLPIGECTRSPERWTAVADDEAKSICRMCPRRWACAREAVELLKSEGLWAGVVIPEGGRGRGHALRQLRDLAERNGYQVRARRIFAEPADELLEAS
jgi:WhiB family transcriptional regulator, redox-sensing transcriptional regulator